MGVLRHIVSIYHTGVWPYRPNIIVLWAHHSDFGTIQSDESRIILYTKRPQIDTPSLASILHPVWWTRLCTKTNG